MAANRISSATEATFRLTPEVAALLARLDTSHPAVQLAFNNPIQESAWGICINEWLRHKGYLALRSEPCAAGTPISECDVDWSRTLAWAEGGSFARVFINMKGRQPNGIVEHGAYERIRSELSARLAQIPDADGRPMCSVSHRPDLALMDASAPDLITVFGDMRWHAIGSLGWNALHVFEDDLTAGRRADEEEDI